jgi:hypothetical protein
MDNSKVVIREAGNFGKGAFAKQKILKGEEIAAWDGPIYDYDYKGWNQDLRDHAIQFERRKWRDSNGMARYINHSCEPNCGIKGLFRIVAMRDIAAGEEITWDYEMTEDSDQWRMQCHCGSKNCRKEIGAYRNMPLEIRAKYAGYISEWLLKDATLNRDRRSIPQFAPARPAFASMASVARP